MRKIYSVHEEDVTYDDGADDGADEGADGNDTGMDKKISISDVDDGDDAELMKKQ